jgi:hypothetical protein
LQLQGRKNTFFYRFPGVKIAGKWVFDVFFRENGLKNEKKDRNLEKNGFFLKNFRKNH